MGEGQGGQRQMLLGGSQGGGVQTQVAADEEGEGAGGLFPLGEPGGSTGRSFSNVTVCCITLLNSL